MLGCVTKLGGTVVNCIIDVSGGPDGSMKCLEEAVPKVKECWPCVCALIKQICTVLGKDCRSIPGC